MTTAGLLFIGLLGGAVIAEQIFGLPGLGNDNRDRAGGGMDNWWECLFW